MKQPLRLIINGKASDSEIEPRCSLADHLREHEGLTGTHLGCEHGVCGACTILFDGEPARSCIMLAVQANGHDIKTVESHVHALGQCRKIIRKLGIRPIVAADTAGSAREIAERGEVLAIIEATRLADLYVQAVREGVTLPPAMARRAQLVTAARDATNAQEIMTAITAVYAATRNSPLFTTMARATASALLNLPPKPEYANVAQEAMRGFLLLGDKKLSLAWTKLALNAAYNNARAMLALDRLMPLVMIAGIDSSTRLEPRDVDRWYEVIRQDDAKTAPMRGYLLLQLFRAVGFDIAPRTTALPEAPPNGARLVMPAAATLQALQSAAGDGRRAEASLLASMAIGETPLIDLHPAAVGTIVRALREAGEDHAARLFAIEIAIAHGL